MSGADSMATARPGYVAYRNTLKALHLQPVEIAERVAPFSLDQLKYEYPHEVCPPRKTPMEHMRDLTWQGAAGQYPAGVPEKVRLQI